MRNKHTTSEELHQLRSQIDEMDSSLINLLAERFKLCREIGKFKKEHNMTILQSERYNEILEKCAQQANACGIDANFAARILEIIHEESVRQQLTMLN